MKRLLFTILIVVVSEVGARTNAPPAGWSPFFRGGSTYNFDAGLDGGGEFSLHRYYAEGGMAYLFRRDRMVSFSAGYGQDDYHFDGVAAEPWNNIENIRAGIFCRWAFDNEWTSFMAGSVRAFGETGVQMSDALTGAIFGGASYRFSDRLSLGPGLGVVGQLDDQPLVFPIIVVDWNITEKLSLSTGGGLAATAGPGLSLSYKMTKHWNVGLVGRYENKRFRLTDDSVAPDGVGEDRNIPVLGTLSYVLYPGTEISGLLGMNLNGRLRAEDKNGAVLYSSEYGNSVTAGLTAKIRF